MKVYLSLISFVFAWNAFASQPKLVARSSTESSFNIPKNALFFDETPVLTDSGAIFIDTLYASEGFNGIHMFNPNTEESRSLFKIQANFRTTDPVFSSRENFYIGVYDQEKSYGVLDVNIKTAQYSEVFSMPQDNKLLLKNMFIAQNQLVFRVQNKREALVGFASWTPENQLQNLDSLLTTKKSYVFAPCSNENSVFAYKERVSGDGNWGESQPDQLVYYFPSVGKRTLISDRDSGGRLDIAKIYNVCHMDSANRVYQMVENSNKEVSLMRLSLGTTETLLKDGDFDIKKIEYFPVSTNSHGEILLRAFDKQNKRAIYLFNKNMELILKLTQGDELLSDKGPAILTHHNKTYPSFSGGVSLSDNGFSFVGYLISKETGQDLGHALYHYRLR